MYHVYDCVVVCACVRHLQHIWIILRVSRAPGIVQTANSVRMYHVLSLRPEIAKAGAGNEYTATVTINEDKSHN